MDNFTPTFGYDRFIVYKTWSYDVSIIYQMTTWTDITAYGLSWFSQAKLNVLFLKVQLPTFQEAYDRLSTSGVELDPDIRSGLNHDIETMISQKVCLWKAVSGDSIKSFCRANSRDIIVSPPEVVGHLRIFTIVWAPQSNDRPKLEGMRAFIQENFAWQLWESQVESVIRKPIQWFGRTAARIFLWDSIHPS
ncbi:hypothetical protein BDV34DRAFT_225229 [Aspergillus parasiticus]|uniref:Uncharacterized protein n=1 Tax=Aspergillus parasiticus TaxID=5067 RepID=A0A5N6DKG3_ASPPA|nr:hypothetical protein BDV34DRAFT_225229 [Aspergillus parasiticus]